MLAKPRCLLDTLTTEPLALESLGAAEDLTGLIHTVFDPSVTLRDLEWLRSQWTGLIVAKGVQRAGNADFIFAWDCASARPRQFGSRVQGRLEAWTYATLRNSTSRTSCRRFAS
jgi:isopentenyl diphosphate isomerase/L-lactate dehydrogenase-like FMN-dependent dehydrogenase